LLLLPGGLWRLRGLWRLGLPGLLRFLRFLWWLWFRLFRLFRRCLRLLRLGFRRSLRCNRLGLRLAGGLRCGRLRGGYFFGHAHPGLKAQQLLVFE
jgi:hypothetical protein